MFASMKPESIETAHGRAEFLLEGEGPTVLALHGAMGGWDQSLLLTRTLAPEVRTLAISRPGYLGTPLSAGAIPKAQADFCAALLDRLGLSRVIVMAVSGGGLTALPFAATYPERVTALVLVSTFAGPLSHRLPLAYYMLKYLGRIPRFAAYMERKARQNPDEAARRSIADSELRARVLADPETGPLFRALLMSTSTRIGERLTGTINDIELTRHTEYDLEAIECPTLVLQGTMDLFLPITENGERLARRIPRAELVRLEGGDHVAIYTHHAQAKSSVSRFLNAVKEGA